MRGDDFPNNGELGIIVLTTPFWIPLVAILGAVWCVGWLARAIFKGIVSMKEASRG